MLQTRTAGWAAQVQGLPRAFWLLWTGTLVNRLGGAVGVFLSLYLTDERGISTAQAGLVLTAYGFGSAVGQPIGGMITDRVGRRPAILLGLVGTAACVPLIGLARGLAALTLAVLAYGLLLDMVRPGVQAAVADVVPEPDRVRAYALNFWAINLGFAVAVPLGGWLVERGWWLLFALDAVTCLAFAVIVALRLPETRPPRLPDAPPGSLREVLADRVLLALVACVVAQAAVYMQAFTTLPLVLRDDGLGPSAYGLVLGLNGLLIIVLQPLVLGVLARAERGVLLLVAGLLQGGGVALHGLADSLSAHAGAVTVWTVGEVLQAGLLASVVARLAPVHLRGRYLGVFGASFGLAGLLAPLLGTQALARLGEPSLWWGCAVLGALSAVGLRLVSAAAAAGGPVDDAPH